MSKEISLIETLATCATVSELCAFTCLAQRKVALIPCIYLNNRCAEVCQQAVQHLKLNFHGSGSCLFVCIEILSLAAEECRKHESVKYCLKCAEICEKCLSECQQALAGSLLTPVQTDPVEELVLLQ